MTRKTKNSWLAKSDKRSASDNGGCGCVAIFCADMFKIPDDLDVIRKFFFRIRLKNVIFAFGWAIFWTTLLEHKLCRKTRPTHRKHYEEQWWLRNIDWQGTTLDLNITTEWFRKLTWRTRRSGISRAWTTGTVEIPSWTFASDKRLPWISIKVYASEWISEIHLGFQWKWDRSGKLPIWRLFISR